MFLCYFDESGSTNHRYVVVGGLVIHESHAATVTQAVDERMRQLPSFVATAELHAQPIRSGKGPWRGLSRLARAQLTDDIVDLLADFSSAGRPLLRLLAVAIERGPHRFEDALAQLHETFFLLGGETLLAGNARRSLDRSLAIGDHSKHERDVQHRAHTQRSDPDMRATLRRYLEPPLFLDSRSSRLAQLADFVSYWTFRAYETGDDATLRRMLPSFDHANGTLTGLVHLAPLQPACACLACESRR